MEKALHLFIRTICSFVIIISCSAVNGQLVNDECASAKDITPDLDGVFICYEETTIGALPDPAIQSPCDMPEFATVWYKFHSSYNPTHFSLHLTAKDDNVAALRLFQTNEGCSQLIPVPLTLNQQFCLTGGDKGLKLVARPIEAEEYYIAVTMLHGAGSDFTLCLSHMWISDGCDQPKSLTLLSRSSGYNWYMPFVPGEWLDFEMTVASFNSTNTGCQWFQGIVPVFGNAWDAASFDAKGQPLNATINGNGMGISGNGVYGSATWDWFDDVGYHYSNPFLQIFDHDGNGTQDLCNLLYDNDCYNAGGVNGGCCTPCWDDPGSTLPPGWFAYGINGTCNAPGPPVKLDWGDGNTCGFHQGPWTFNFSLQVKTFPDCLEEGENSSLSIGFSMFTDGEVGAWTGVNSMCATSPPIVERLPSICTDEFGEGIFFDTIACNGDTMHLPLKNFARGNTSIDYWEYYISPGVQNQVMGYALRNGEIVIPAINTHPANQREITIRLLGYSDFQEISVEYWVTVIIYPEIKAGFTADIDGFEVDFRSNLRIDSSFYWSFGDGQNSTLRDPDHTYEHDGIYTVQQIINTPCGSDTATAIITILNLPGAEFEISENIVCVNDTIQLTSITASHVEEYDWYVEGGVILEDHDQIAHATFSDPGSYDIGLIVHNSLGSDTLLLPDAVHVQEFPMMNYEFYTVDSIVHFNYTGTEADVSWLIDEEILHTGYFVADTFEDSGIYTVRLIALNICGSDTVYFDVDLNFTSLPVADFVISDTVICIYDTIVLRSIAVSEIDTYEWYLEGGTTWEDDQQQIHATFTSPGVFDAGLVVHNSVGSDTLVILDAIRVEELPLVTYDLEVYDTLVVFNYTGSTQAEVSWILADSLTLEGDSVSHIFSSSGTYPVKLIAENNCGIDTVFFSVILTITSMEDLSDDSGISIYPNPAKDQIHIGTKDGNRIRNIRLVSAHGVELPAGWIDKNGEQWILNPDASATPGGLYILIVETESGIRHSKVVVQR